MLTFVDWIFEGKFLPSRRPRRLHEAKAKPVWADFNDQEFKQLLSKTVGEAKNQLMTDILDFCMELSDGGLEVPSPVLRALATSPTYATVYASDLIDLYGIHRVPSVILQSIVEDPELCLHLAGICLRKNQRIPEGILKCLYSTSYSRERFKKEAEEVAREKGMAASVATS